MIRATKKRKEPETIKVSFVQINGEFHDESQSILAALALAKSLRRDNKEAVAITIELTPDEVRELIAAKMTARKSVAV